MALALGAWLRVDQLASQVLMEDEWHPVHQLIYYPLEHIVSSFGNADYSIPLVLLYYLESGLFGLTELTLRGPMLIAGLATIVVLPLMLRPRLDDRIVALFAILLAVSPFLISYSRIARPYAITLLGAYVAAWLFNRATQGRRLWWIPGTGYALACGLVVWMHLIAGPVLIAPLVAAWFAWLRRKGMPLPALLGVTAVTGILMAVAVVPPLIADAGALSGKAGIDSITMQTVIGAGYLFAGTGSSIALVVACVFAMIGLPRVLMSSPIVRWICLGVLFTVILLLVTKPWWVDRPLAFGRYILPALPVFLLSISTGMVKTIDAIRARLRGSVPSELGWGALAVTLAMAAWATTTRFSELLRRPNSYTQHSYFQLDYRDDMNGVRYRMLSYPMSSFWSTLSTHPAGSVTVAVAPFRYATYEWPGPKWEEDSRQRVIPAFVWGACSGPRHGEVPPADQRFRFRNAIHLAQPQGWPAHHVDYVAYYRGPMTDTFEAAPECEAWMRKHLGKPVHEDAALVVWAARPSAQGSTQP